MFTHGDLHAAHVLVRDNKVTGILDWSEASRGDALFDLATLTFAHPEHLDDVLAGYGTEVDRDMIRAWRSWRCLVAIRWLFENGLPQPGHLPRSQGPPISRLILHYQAPDTFGHRMSTVPVADTGRSQTWPGAVVFFEDEASPTTRIPATSAPE